MLLYDRDTEPPTSRLRFGHPSGPAAYDPGFDTARSVFAIITLMILVGIGAIFGLAYLAVRIMGVG